MGNVKVWKTGVCLVCAALLALPGYGHIDIAEAFADTASEVREQKGASGEEPASRETAQSEATENGTAQGVPPKGETAPDKENGKNGLGTESATKSGSDESAIEDGSSSENSTGTALSADAFREGGIVLEGDTGDGAISEEQPTGTENGISPLDAGSPAEFLIVSGGAYTTDADGTVVLTESGPYTVSMAGSAAASTTGIRVTSTAGATILLDGVNIDTSAQDGQPAFLISKSAGAVTLKLGGASSLKSGSFSAGLQKETEAELVITSYAGDGVVSGTLNATGGRFAAGIGSGYAETGDSAVSNITIKGGTINAASGARAAGIGSGRATESGATSSATNITIAGGSVYASSYVKNASGGAAIGSGVGVNSYASGISISGGTVKAISGLSGAGGAGIGSGYAEGYMGGDAAECSSIAKGILISGGVVEAVGGSPAPGIGSGSSVGFSSATNISISDGTVKATGATSPGIGSGSAYTESIVAGVAISGGAVEAVGGWGSPGIGGGTIWGDYGEAPGGKITMRGIVVSGGKVTATGSPAGRYGDECNYEAPAFGPSEAYVANVDNPTKIVFEDCEVTPKAGALANIWSGASADEVSLTSANEAGNIDLADLDAVYAQVWFADSAAVAFVGTTAYTLLPEAFEAAGNGKVVALAQDVDLSGPLSGISTFASMNDYVLSVPEGKNVKLDLNGHKVDVGTHHVRAFGVLSVRDTSAKGGGTIRAEGDFGCILVGGAGWEGSSLVMEGGMILSEGSGAGIMVLPGASLEMRGGNALAMESGGIANYGTCLVSDGDVDGKLWGIMALAGSLKITGGTFSSSATGSSDARQPGALYVGIDHDMVAEPAAPVVEVSGGSFSARTCALRCETLGSADGALVPSVLVTDGTFIGRGTAVSSSWPDAVKLQGGEYRASDEGGADVSAWCAEGYAPCWTSSAACQVFKPELQLTAFDGSSVEAGEYRYEGNCILVIYGSGDYAVSMVEGVSEANSGIRLANGAASSLALDSVLLNPYYKTAGIDLRSVESATLYLKGANTIDAMRSGSAAVSTPCEGSLAIVGADAGSSLTAIGGYSRPAIGSDAERYEDDAVCENLVIENTTLTATGGDYAAGIGTGASTEGSATVRNLIIRNSTIVAQGGVASAGIGGGWAFANNTVSDIAIENSTVTATGGFGGPGIGSGYADTGDSVLENAVILNSTVVAQGGISDKQDIEAAKAMAMAAASGDVGSPNGIGSGPGIGSGFSDKGNSTVSGIVITGGSVTATAGVDQDLSGGAPGIGSGPAYSGSSTATGIELSGDVVAQGGSTNAKNQGPATLPAVGAGSAAARFASDNTIALGDGLAADAWKGTSAADAVQFLTRFSESYDISGFNDAYLRVSLTDAIPGSASDDPDAKDVSLAKTGDTVFPLSAAVTAMFGLALLSVGISSAAVRRRKRIHE